MDNKTSEHFRKLFLDIKKNTILNDLTLEKAFERETKGDDADLVAGERDNELLLKLRGRQNFFIKKVDDALTRISKGTFGQCFECECDIEKTRLTARPTATLCIGCKEEEERGEGHILYQKRSHTLGQSIESNIVNLPMNDEEIGNNKVLKFNRDRIRMGLQQ